MAVSLFKTDYMSVVWEYTEKNKSKYLNLFFTIQVNGKMKTSQHFLELTKRELNSSYEWDAQLTLKQWDAWYSIRKLLTDIWYPLWWDMNFLEWWNIETWIDRAYNAYKDPDTFDFWVM